MNAELLNLQNLIERSCFAGCLHLAWKQWTEICNTIFISLPNIGANCVRHASHLSKLLYQQLYPKRK